MGEDTVVIGGAESGSASPPLTIPVIMVIIRVITAATVTGVTATKL